jgi:hypothetical protein
MNDWAKLVKKVYNDNKSKPGYMLKHAMRDAKKLYKPSSKSTVKKHHKKSGTKKRRNKSERKQRK